MKKMQNGFTLAEVLVTLAIIGVVAALTLPNLLVNNQYKAVGTKLAKFLSTTEQATRAYVAGNNSFDNSTNSDIAEIAEFINDTYLIDSIGNGDNINLEEGTTPSDPRTKLDPTNSSMTRKVAKLKDGTYVSFSMCQQNNGTISDNACKGDVEGRGKGIFGTNKVGNPVYKLSFDPNVGTPNSVQHNFTFVVTELGFVYPAANEPCLWNIYNNKFDTKAKMFKKGASCDGSATRS